MVSPHVGSIAYSLGSPSSMIQIQEAITKKGLPLKKEVGCVVP